MTLRLRFLGIEVWTLTLDVEHDPEPEPGEPQTPPPSTHAARWAKQAKRVAAHWALG